MNRRSIETMVGGFVLLGVAGIAFLSLKAANLAAVGERDSYTVSARFDNIGGLKPRAPVKSAGVTVGRVLKISLDPKTFQGVVTMALDSDVQFPADSSAKILTSGLLGDQYIGIEAGASEKNLAAGAKLSNTQSAIVLENLIGQLVFNRAADAGTQSGSEPKK